MQILFFRFPKRSRLSFILDELLFQSRVRPVCIDGFDLKIRSASSDVEVVFTNLCTDTVPDVPGGDPKFLLDAGANIGTYALLLSRAFPGAQIIALEPEKANYELLVENTRSVSAITAVQAALWSTDGELHLQDRGTGHWGFTVCTSDAGRTRTSQKIQAVSMPSLLAESGFSTFDLVKMDIEGAENEIFEHCPDWFQFSRSFLIETHDRIIPGTTSTLKKGLPESTVVQRSGEKFFITPG